MASEQLGVEVDSTEIKKRSRRAFVKWALAMTSGVGGIAWLRSRELEKGIPWPFRRVQQLNEWVGGRLFSTERTVKQFPDSLATVPRTNGWYGWPSEAPKDFQLTVEQADKPARQLALNQVFEGLERIEHTTELKCIEGWSVVTTWGGVRFADFASKLGLTAASFPFIRIATADQAYYVGLDAVSAFHPETLLCDSMNGQPLKRDHGAPIRLIIPVKYGIKNIKWLATIQFLNERPEDFWAERGYDWFAGL